MVLVTGDTHIPNDVRKLNNDNIKKACNGVFPNYVIITGDFGLLWSNGEQDQEEIYWKNWLNEKPYKILFVDGNHENFTRINSLPEIEMFGSKVGKVSDNIFHLKRGHIYTIEDKTFFCLGGAESTDKQFRREYVSWWFEEIPTYKEYHTALENLKKYNNTVDYVITHTAPKNIIETYFNFYTSRIKDSTASMLQNIYENTIFKKWFFGHFHEDKKLNDKFIVCYNGYNII